ncbi:hypothetical protein BU23DRAFT_552217 [Bimuria novae-zelandiae CBS 107.79]|uniref:Uncharacterized protein n=1 Tax=Bimuria novae-zelandiae CBS 107.79 TaxID=1447943 RepID=A0A6A5VG86_9PLEO|nr:hypothetical protein BU23DRAFT_552217 [Bimuria novae-zelandiae CBS 107.79]
MASKPDESSAQAPMHSPGNAHDEMAANRHAVEQPSTPAIQEELPSHDESSDRMSSTPVRSSEQRPPSIQITSSPPVHESYELRYSPPNVSAVSSLLTSPATPSFIRPRHPRSSSPDADLSSSPIQEDRMQKPVTEEDDIDCSDSEVFQRGYSVNGEDNGDEAGEGDFEEGNALTYYGAPQPVWDVNDPNIDPESREYVLSARAYTLRLAAKEEAEKDDAEDVMNPPIEGGEGFVVPRVEGFTSVGEEELGRILSNGTGPDGAHDFSQDDGTASPWSSTHSLVRRASSPSGRPMSSFGSLNVMRAGSRAHVKFAADAAASDTPFAKTMKYFKKFTDKENTPSKSRRNASLPDEIAELAKAAQQEGIEDDKEMWDKYMEIDFAPDDPVMGDEIAGDLIMMGTPTRQGGRIANGHCSSTPLLHPKHQVASRGLEKEGTVYEVSIPGHYDDAFQLRFRSKSSFEHVASFIRQRGEDLEASPADIDYVVEEFLKSPSNFIVTDESPDAMGSELGSQDGKSVADSRGRNSIEAAELKGTPSAKGDSEYQDHEYGDAGDKQLILYQEDPVFVKVIGMLPQAMFWTVAQPIARYTNKAFDKTLGMLTGLSLNPDE